MVRPFRHDRKIFNGNIKWFYIYNECCNFEINLIYKIKWWIRNIYSFIKVMCLYFWKRKINLTQFGC